MVLEYLEIHAPYDHLVRVLGITPDLGAPASNITRLAADLNIQTTYRSGDLAALKKYVQQSVPCIAFVHTIQLSYWEEEVWHAVVVVGIDESKVYLNDPFFKEAPQAVSHLEFLLAWDEMDNTFAVITP